MKLSELNMQMQIKRRTQNSMESSNVAKILVSLGMTLNNVRAVKSIKHWWALWNVINQMDQTRSERDVQQKKNIFKWDHRDELCTIYYNK